VIIGLLGDLHGKPLEALDWINRIQPDFCLQVGDYCCYDTWWPVPVYWIFGNHEHPLMVQWLQQGNNPLPPNNNWLPGGLYDINGVSVMALPGLPQKRPGPGPAGFDEDVYDLCMSRSGEHVDIFISHGCAFPFSAFVGSQYMQLEETAITQLVCAASPSFAVSGHNHSFAVESHGGVVCIRMGEVPTDFTYVLGEY
jgi:hypothetical protein